MIDFDELFAKRANHIKPGLERIARSYQYLQKPSAQIPSVLIGGTNGKGSTSGFLWAMLAANSKRVGLYSSPHLISFAERFQISDRPVDEQLLAQIWRSLEADLPSAYYEELSFFELATLIAFRLFEQLQVDCQVLEVGLGGRWDATNISDPTLSILVSVSKDHAEYLGSDLLGILREKMGILRPGRPFLWGEGGEVTACDGYREVLTAELAKHACPLYSAGEHFFIKDTQLVLKFPGQEPVQLPLGPQLQALAPYLQSNLALAAAGYQLLRQLRPELALKSLSDIWQSWQGEAVPAPMTLLGRCQRILVPAEKGGQALCLDVCHNPDGARRFVEAWERMGRGARVPALISVLRDKEFDRILDILRAHFAPIVLYRSASERAWHQEDLAERHRDLPFCESLAEAWQKMSVAVPHPGHVWVACGSVFAIGQLLSYLGTLPKDLHVARVLAGDWILDAHGELVALRSGTQSDP